MKPYHKIQSIYKRDQKGKFIIGDCSTPELDYLWNNEWIFEEKIDGTNIRVIYDGEKVYFGGRTNNAQIPVPLMNKLTQLFPLEAMQKVFTDVDPETSVCLYGEGYGAKIQKGGGNYISDGVDFALFDVAVNTWLLKREDVLDVARRFFITKAPFVDEGTLGKAIGLVENGLKSQFGDFQAEGLVLRPKFELVSRNGQRVITKVKCKDFK